MKKLFLAVGLILLATKLMADGDYIVIVNDDADGSDVARFHNVGRKKEFKFALKGFLATLNDDKLDKLKRDTRVKIVEPDVQCQAFSQVLPTGVQRIGTLSNTFAKIGLHANNINVDVAIIDTGIDLTHTDLNVYQHVSFSTNNTTGNDGNGHGTHCAGIVGALDNDFGVVGVAPGVRLWAVKVLDDDGTGNLSTIIQGVDYVYSHATEIEVASMSLGGQGLSDSLRTAIQACVNAGVVFVVAAGNSAFDVYGGDRVLGTSDDFFPASYPEVLTVSALVDTDGLPGGLGNASISYGLDDSLATFSNYSINVDASNPVISPGKAIDVAAPGVSIYSTFKGNSYATMSGTSMACPHVAGAVALYIAQYGRAFDATSVATIRQAIINSGEPEQAWSKNFYNPNWLIEKNPEPLLRVDYFPANTNSYPVVKITYPDSGPNLWGFTSTNVIPFSGTATDARDGDISANLIWYYVVDATPANLSKLAVADLGTGSSFSSTMPNGGYTAVIALVTNSLGFQGSYVSYLNITAPNNYSTPPTVSITSPTNNASFTNGAIVSFVGTASDIIDGNLTSRLNWSSSLSGSIGTGGSFSTKLTTGTNVITASCVDNGNLTGTNRITVFVTGTPPPVTNNPPTISVSSPLNGATNTVGNTVYFTGQASDVEDGNLSSSIKWNDNLAGLLGTGSSISSSSLVAGVHTVTASVLDSMGSSASTSRTFTMQSPITNATLNVTIGALPSVVSNKQKLTITGNVKSSGINVSGATMQFTIITANGKQDMPATVVSDSSGNGKVYYTVNKNKGSSGLWTVVLTASKANYSSGTTNATFSVR